MQNLQKDFLGYVGFGTTKFKFGQIQVILQCLSRFVFHADAITGKIVEKLRYYKSKDEGNIIRDVSWHPYNASLVSAGFDGSLVEYMHSTEPLEDHIARLPSPNFDHMRRYYY